MANSQNHLAIKFTMFLLLFLLTGGFLAQNLEAQQSLPLVQKTDLEYLGAFRLPRGGNGTENGFSFGGSAIAYNPQNNSLFVLTRESFVGEVKIPMPVKSADIEKLPFATLIQNISDPLEGMRSVLEGSSVRGLHVVGNKLYGTAYIYYDANNSARVSHFSRSTDLTATSSTPLKALWLPEKSGYVSGMLAAVPSEWQEVLGGDMLSGNCCVPIISRTSFGPAAFSWKTWDFPQEPIPATPLLYYTTDHSTLGAWDGSNPVWGNTTEIGGMVIPSGTRSLLYFGLNGTGTPCYGVGGATGECVDPLSSSKGPHAYPYNYQVWAYDLNDLAAVKGGSKKPWDIKPYSVWTLEFPNSFISTYGIGGVTYDSNDQIIYLSQNQADTDGYSSRALIHAYKIKIAAPKAKVTEKPASIEYNNANDTAPLGGEEIKIGGESQPDPYLDHRDAPRSWFGTYRRAFGYVGHLFSALFSRLTP
jgi:hypothetical protein